MLSLFAISIRAETRPQPASAFYPYIQMRRCARRLGAGIPNDPSPTPEHSASSKAHVKLRVHLRISAPFALKTNAPRTTRHPRYQTTPVPFPDASSNLLVKLRVISQSPRLRVEGPLPTKNEFPTPALRPNSPMSKPSPTQVASALPICYTLLCSRVKAQWEVRLPYANRLHQ
jgi:hypothetical protein